MKFSRRVWLVALFLSAAFLSGCSMAGSSGSGANTTAPGGGSGNASAAPAVSAVSPNSGPTTGGTTVSIKGSNFATGALVFFGAVAAAAITVNGPTQIQAVTPSTSNSGVVSVAVQNSDGQSANVANGFTYTSDPSNSPPTVSGVSPSTSIPGAQVTVNGTNFASGAAVTVGSAVASNVQFLSPTQLTAMVPNVSPGTYDVTVANTNGLSATLSPGLTISDPTSLLPGCTVTASNQPTCAIPAGWTDVVNESFEGGKLGNPGIENVSGGTIECNVAHTGSCAFQGNYNSSEDATYWTLAQGAIGSSHEIYISWWQMDTSGETAGNNDSVASFKSATGDGGSGQTTFNLDDWETGNTGSGCLNGQGPNASYSCQNAVYVLETFFANGSPATAHYGAVLAFPISWTQFEIHYKANTSTGGVANTDGEIQEYRDGQLILSTSGDLNKLSTMAGMQIQIGSFFEQNGYYTSSAYTTCAAFGTTSYNKIIQPFSAAAPCPVPPNFTKYWDDIIVLKK